MNKDFFNEEMEREQDIRARESLNRLDSYLNSNEDYMESMEEDDVKIEDLRKLIDQLEDMKKEYEVPQNDGEEINQTQGNSETKGKRLVKSLPNAPKIQEEYDSTAREIATSFINCFILCLVTAIMGTGWFLYIINHI